MSSLIKILLYYRLYFKYRHKPHTKLNLGNLKIISIDVTIIYRSCPVS